MQNGSQNARRQATINVSVVDLSFVSSRPTTIEEVNAACKAAAEGPLKGVLGYGATARIRTTKILDLSADLSLVIEIVDEEGKIEAFQQTLSDLFEQANCGGLVTLENIRVVHYLPEKHH